MHVLSRANRRQSVVNAWVCTASPLPLQPAELFGPRAILVQGCLPVTSHKGSLAAQSGREREAAKLVQHLLKSLAKQTALEQSLPGPKVSFVGTSAFEQALASAAEAKGHCSLGWN